MRKMKKINGYLVVKFNARELREYEGTALGEYGVIDAELYTGILDVDRGAMEYDNAGSMEEAVELARGLESELDAEEPEVKVTIVKETDETTKEEEVDAQQMIAGWENVLRGQVASAHYKDVDERTAAHELYGYKVALRDLGLLDREDCYVLPDTFGEAPGPLPKKPEELLAYVCDELCRHRRPEMPQEELDAVCEKCSLERLANEADGRDLRAREKALGALYGLVDRIRDRESSVEADRVGAEARAYSNPGGVPHILHVDNGKDYTAKTMTGQSRKKRNIDFEFDAETVGFYQSIGIEEVGRSLPYQPWDKPIERFFSTVCSKFSKWFESYTGTLTGSKTYAKRQKDIDGMLERGELLTMEEFFEAWTKWKNEKYHTREHRGLKDAGEKWITPISLFENGERYEKAAPPREYAAMLLMKADTARVTNQGINKFGTLYTDYELCHYVGKHVGIKWDIDDVTKLYVFDQEGRKICEAVSAELLAFGPHCSQAALERHLRDQKRQEKEMREILDSMTRPYEARIQEGGRPSEAVGMIDLTIKAERPSKLISLPNDKEFRAEMAAGRKTGKKASGDEFLGKKADDALARLRAMNE